MPLLWKEEYNLGIPSIDIQHRRLIDIINEFSCRATEDSVSHADIDVMLVRVEAHAREHFTYEEGFFIRYNYSDAMPHHQEHEAFLAKIEEFREKTKAEKTDLFVEVLDYLEQWFLHHVLVVDRRYVELFLAEGIE